MEYVVKINFQHKQRNEGFCDTIKILSELPKPEIEERILVLTMSQNPDYNIINLSVFTKDEYIEKLKKEYNNLPEFML